MKTTSETTTSNDEISFEDFTPRPYQVRKNRTTFNALGIEINFH